jgi:indole-3-glycerol phosphate synthase
VNAKTLDLASVAFERGKIPWPLGKCNLPKRSLLEKLHNRTSSIGIIGEVRNHAPTYGKDTHYSPEVLIDFYSEHVDAIEAFTEPTLFGGKMEWLTLAKQRSTLPVLCLDLIISAQELESIESFGADAVILFAYLLDAAKLSSLTTHAQDLGLEVIIEIGNEEEIERAVKSKPNLIGIDTRDRPSLSTVDLEKPQRLRPLLPTDMPVIVESGIDSPTDISMYRDDFSAVLIGSAFVESNNLLETFQNLDAGRKS